MLTEAMPQSDAQPEKLDPANLTPFGELTPTEDPRLGELSCAAAGVGVPDTIDTTQPDLPPSWVEKDVPSLN